MLGYLDSNSPRRVYTCLVNTVSKIFGHDVGAPLVASHTSMTFILKYGEYDARVTYSLNTAIMTGAMFPPDMSEVYVFMSCCSNLSR